MRERDNFFVGYLPTPRGLRRWLFAAAICAVVSMLVTAILIAGRQRSPGEGKWEVGRPRQIEGVYVDTPYPMLHARDATLLLVAEGKVVAPAEASLRNRWVRASGTVLHRGEM